MTYWTWASASCRGTSHERTGQPLQDAYSCFSRSLSGKDFFVGIVSDGAGSAEYGGAGASLICRVITQAARLHFVRGDRLPTRTEIECWVDEARDRIYNAARMRGKSPRDFAATFLCAVSDGEASVIAHIGDGCVVVRERGTGEWIAPTWPDHGEYASTTSFLTDESLPRLRVSMSTGSIDVIALFSDGIERLVLDMLAKKPFEGFFSAIARPVFASTMTRGRDRALSQQLAGYLASEQVNARTDDDKTLVVAVLR